MSEEMRTVETFLSAVLVFPLKTLVAVTSVAMAAVGQTETDSANLRGACRSATGKRIGNSSLSVARGASDTPVSTTHEAYAHDIPGETLSVETLGWTGSGTTNGWRYVSLGTPFPDGAARFAAGARIESPRWRELDILSAEVKLRCSTNAPNRFLTISFLQNGNVVSGPVKFDAVFAADRPESQTLPVSRSRHANGIALSLSDGTVGEWGVYEVRVGCEATTGARPGFGVVIR